MVQQLMSAYHLAPAIAAVPTAATSQPKSLSPGGMWGAALSAIQSLLQVAETSVLSFLPEISTCADTGTGKMVWEA